MAYDTNLFEVKLCEENPDEYLTNPYFNYTYTQKGINGITNTVTSATFSHGASNEERMAFYIVEFPPFWSEAGETAPNCVTGVSALNSTFSEFTIFLTGSINHYDEHGDFIYSENFADSPLGAAATGDFSGHVGSPRYPQYGYLHYDTNIPFFSTAQEAQDYIRTGDGINKALNYKQKSADDYQYQYYIYNTVVVSQSNNYGGVVNILEHINKYVHFQPSDYKMCLYKSDSTTSNVDNIFLKQNYPCIYSTDNISWFDSDNSPFISFLDKPIVVGGKQYTPEIFETNIPIFENSTDAQDYLNGIKDIEDALNYNLIKDNGVAPNIGTDQTTTDLQSNYLKSKMSSIFCCSSSNLSDITNLLFNVDGNIFDQIKEGLSLYGLSPIDFVSSLMYYPIDTTTLCNGANQSYVMFGTYKADLSSPCFKVVYNNKLLNMGSFNYVASYNDFRDFEPYTKCYIYLPYCGIYQLNISKYIDKTLVIKYGIDVLSGLCKSMLFADGLLVDSYEGQIGVNMPITATQNASWANAQSKNLQNAIVGGVNNLVNTGTSIGNPTGLLRGGTNTLLDFHNDMKNVNALTTIPVTTKGSPSPNIDKFMPQYPYLIFAIQETIEPKNIRQTFGKPDNSIGTLSNYSGYIVCDIDRITTTATKTENETIATLLNNGIII